MKQTVYITSVFGLILSAGLYAANADLTDTAAPSVAPAAITTLSPIDCIHPWAHHFISDSELSMWAQQATLKAFEFRYNEVDEQLQLLKHCFTEQGWVGFYEALQQSGNLQTIKTQQLTVSSQVSGDTTISKIKADHWHVRIPISVVYQNTQEKFTQALSVTMVVTKKSSEDLGIVQFIATIQPQTISSGQKISLKDDAKEIRSPKFRSR